MTAIPIVLKSFKSYHYYSNQNKNPSQVLLQNETITNEEIIVAYRYYNNANEASYLFFKFKSFDYFIKNIFNKTCERRRRYFAVIVADSRCLYLDIDHYCAQIPKNINNIIVREIFSQINKLSNDIKYDDLYVWTANREISKTSHKISLHIICPKITFQTTKTLKNYIETIKTNLKTNKNAMIRKVAESIDLSPYKNHCQLWRLPLNHNYKQDSILLQFSTQLLTDYEQIQINYCIPHFKSFAESFNSLRNKISNKNKSINYQYFNSGKHYETWSSICRQYKIRTNCFFDNIFYCAQWIQYDKDRYYVAKSKCLLHLCEHKRNRASVWFYMNGKYKYISVKCLDFDDCSNFTRYLSLEPKLKYPWIFENIVLSTTQIIKLDQYIDSFLKLNNISNNNKNNNYFIFNVSSARYHVKNFYLSIYLAKNIVCHYCNDNRLHIQYRKPFHKYYTPSREIALFCVGCDQFLNV